MSIKHFSIFIFILVLVSCNQEVKKPDNLIPEEKMKAIVQDMYIYKNLEEINFSKRKEKEPVDVTLSVLKKHHVSLEAFEKSYKYYTIQNASYDVFLEDIKEELQQSEYAPKSDKTNATTN